MKSRRQLVGINRLDPIVLGDGSVDRSALAFVEPATGLELANSGLQKREGSVPDVAGYHRVEAHETLQEYSRLPELTLSSNEPGRLGELWLVENHLAVDIRRHHPERVAITVRDVPIDRPSRAEAGAVFVVDPGRRPSELSKPRAVIPGEIDIVHHLVRVEPVEFLTEYRDGLAEPRRLCLDCVVQQLFIGH